eukprot:3060970-Pyramimonas_sp.AAC.1
MSAQTTGCRRMEFFDAVAQKLGEDDEVYQCAMQSNSVHAVWEHIGGAVRPALAEVLPPGSRLSDEYETNRKRRMELIRQRGRLRAEGAEKNPEQFQGIQRQLHIITRTLQNLRKRQTADTRQALLHDLAEVWKQHKWAQMRNINNSLTSTGRGPKKRYRFAVRQSMTVAEWRHGLQLPPQQGGMSADIIDWDNAFDDAQFLPKVPERDRAIQLAKADLEGQVRYLMKAPKRRATPPWGVYAEAMLQLLSPTYHSAEDQAGN